MADTSFLSLKWKRTVPRLWKYKFLAAIVVLYIAVLYITGYRNSPIIIGYLPTNVGIQNIPGALIQNGRPLTNIKTVLINEDVFLRGCRKNGLFDEVRHMRTPLRSLKQNVSRTFRISLTREEQVSLENSTVARDLRNTWKKIIRYENTHKMVPIKFLPEFKSPCWFNAKRQLRCLPYFLLIGAPKAGTSDVYTMLQAHPDFRSRYSEKEPHWITRGRFCTRNLSTPCPETTFDRYTEVIAKPIRYMLKIEAAQSTKSRRKDGNQRRGTSQLNSEDQQMMTVARNMITGDCSASTLFDNHNWPLNDENILPLEPIVTNADFVYRLYNNTKIMAILRNPITRLYSDYIYFDKTRQKGPDEFHREVVDAIRYYNDCFEKYSVRTCIYLARTDHRTPEAGVVMDADSVIRVPQCLSNRARLFYGKKVKTVDFSETIAACDLKVGRCRQLIEIMKVQLEKGIYFVQLQEWFRVFPRDQIMILRLEDYTRHRTQTVLSIYKFLDFREFTNKQDIAVFTFITNGSRVYNHMERPGYSSDDMALETRYILYEFYKPFNQALARLLNDSRFDYGPC